MREIMGLRISITQKRSSAFLSKKDPIISVGALNLTAAQTTHKNSTSIGKILHFFAVGEGLAPPVSNGIHKHHRRSRMGLCTLISFVRTTSPPVGEGLAPPVLNGIHQHHRCSLFSSSTTCVVPLPRWGRLFVCAAGSTRWADNVRGN